MAADSKLDQGFWFPNSVSGWAFHHELIVWRCLWGGYRGELGRICGRVSVVGVGDHMVTIPIT